MKKNIAAINDLLAVMAKLRSPQGCPWDQEQDHKSLRFHAVEEVYELIDAIEAGDDHEMMEELGDLLLQVVFHCQLAQERGAFDFAQVCRHIVDKLVRRHPHVFGSAKVKTVEAVWTQWERIKKAEKHGTRHERPSALDGIPKHLPALLRAEKVVKKARKAGLAAAPAARPASGAGNARRTGGGAIVGRAASRAEVGRKLFALAACAQRRGWSAEELLLAETRKVERNLRRQEREGTRRSG